MGIESVELVLDLEIRFGIQFPDRIARQARTVRDLEDQVLSLRSAQPATLRLTDWDEASVRAETRGIVAHVLGIDVALVTPDSDLVRDLGLDA